jgi:P-type Cu+ transporter
MGMEKIEMNIEGMHCGACATGIQMLTTQMDGVGEVFVDYEGKKGTFEFDPEKTSLDKIVAAIKDLGYTASEAQ